jgi:hypothetical protein
MHSLLHESGLGCTWAVGYAHERPGIHMDGQVCTEVVRYAQGRTGMHSGRQVCTGVDRGQSSADMGAVRYIQGRSGMHTVHREGHVWIGTVMYG